MTWLLKLAAGNPLLLLWVGGGIFLAGMASGGSGAWWVQGLRLEALRGEYAIRDREAQEEADKRLQEALLRVREAEKRSAEDVAAVAEKLEKEKANAAKRAQKVISDLHTGVLSLRVQLDTRSADQGSGTATGPAGAPAGGCNGAAGGGLPQPTSATLSKADSEFLISEASRADAVVTQLQAAQAVILKDREVCR